MSGIVSILEECEIQPGDMVHWVLRCPAGIGRFVGAEKTGPGDWVVKLVGVQGFDGERHFPATEVFLVV